MKSTQQSWLHFYTLIMKNLKGNLKNNCIRNSIKRINCLRTDLMNKVKKDLHQKLQNTAERNFKKRK